jgi:hypothetical protein
MDTSVTPALVHCLPTDTSPSLVVSDPHVTNHFSVTTIHDLVSPAHPVDVIILDYQNTHADLNNIVEFILKFREVNGKLGFIVLVSSIAAKNVAARERLTK